MRYRTQVLAGAALGAALLLQGCSVMRTLGLIDRKPKVEMAVQTPARQPAGAYTATGRTQLDHNNYGLAIDAFQMALTQGETAGPALNGLGVAYAGIGRTDLAAEYFRRAMAVDPANDRYAGNLAMLLKTRPLDEALPRQALVIPPVAIPAQPPADVAVQDAPRGRLTRVAPREYTIHVLSRATGHGAEMASVDPQFRPVAKFVLPQITHANKLAPADKPAAAENTAPAKEAAH